MRLKSIGITTILFLGLIVAGCSSNPLIPTDLSPTHDPTYAANSPIMGIYNVSIDPYGGTAEAALNRSAMLTLNIVGLLNVTPAGLLITLNGTDFQPDYVDVDVNMSIKHPVENTPGLNAYDMFGVVIGDGSGALDYNPDLSYSMPGTDMELVNADGYTRWFNQDEFSTPGLFGYTPGLFSSPGYSATATLNPYKYFADGLGATGDLWTFLTTTLDNGVFSSGSTVTRNMIVRFPIPGSFNFTYAVVVNWNGDMPDDHPANTREAVGFDISVTDDIMYSGPGSFSGNLIADISIFDWFSQLTGGVMEDYIIKIEPTVLSGVYTASASNMTPAGSGAGYFTYHFDIPADNVTGLDGNEFWVIVEYPPNDYSNPLSIPNTASGTLAAFTRHGINVQPGVQSNNVSMVGFSFDPVDITVKAGSDVTWTNEGSFPHTATTDPLNPVAGGPDSDSQYPLGMGQGDIYAWTVPEVPSGTVWYYHCRFHGFAGDGTSPGSGMVGSITVE